MTSETEEVGAEEVWTSAPIMRLKLGSKFYFDSGILVLLGEERIKQFRELLDFLRAKDPALIAGIKQVSRVQAASIRKESTAAMPSAISGAVTSESAAAQLEAMRKTVHVPDGEAQASAEPGVAKALSGEAPINPLANLNKKSAD